MITGLSHINLLVPPGTLPLATAFYSTTLGLTPRPVPAHRVHDLAWFEIWDSGQEVHIAPDYNGINGTVKGEEGGEAKWSSRHPCFRLGSPELLEELRVRIWKHFEDGGEAAPLEADRPGGVASGELVFLQSIVLTMVIGNLLTFLCLLSGDQGVEYPKRFFARDYAGNRLEFSL